MKLYFADIRDILPEHINMISPRRAEQARRYRFADDQKRCVAGGLLLRRFLGDTEVYTDDFGKPRAESGVCFNLSHSGDWVILAVGETEVGCDIERFKLVDPLRLGKVVYTGAELEYISSNPDRLGRFYELWTKKEALLKCMGKGFHRAAKTVEVTGDRLTGDRFAEDGDIYYFKTMAFSDYTVSVCTKNTPADIETEWVRL